MEESIIMWKTGRGLIICSTHIFRRWLPYQVHRHRIVLKLLILLLTQYLITNLNCQTMPVIQGGPKITERHTSGNNGKWWLVSVDGVFSPEKNNTKISNFGQAVLILEHVITVHVRFKNFTPHFKLCLKTRQKTLTIVNFVNGHCLDQQRIHRIGV